MEENIRKLNTLMAFTAAMIVAVSITLYVQYGQKDMLINGKKSKFTAQKLYDLSLLASAIFLIVIIYFEIVALEQFNNSPTKANRNFLIAATLSLVAQSIRITTLFTLNPSSQVGAEDVIP